jgi:hypothetical protein
LADGLIPVSRLLFKSSGISCVKFFSLGLLYDRLVFLLKVLKHL